VPPLEPLYEGPYSVLARSRDWFRIQVGNRTDTISTSHLKPCLDPSAPPAEPRRRGRPPGPPKTVTFCWPPMAPPPACHASPAVPATPSPLSPAPATARPPTPPGLGPGTVFSPHRQGFFFMPGPLPGAAAIHTDRAAATRPVAAGQVRPVASSGGAVWRRMGAKYS
jgi:hypothetical protein